jgi:hypothetical protein
MWKNIIPELMDKGEEQRVTERPSRIFWYANDDHLQDDGDGI